ncbi:MAG: hypothetical protein AAFU54_18885 [Chloroflexota bacterium]
MSDDTPTQPRRSEFLYVWFGWLPPPRYLSVFFFLLLVFGLSVLAFGFVKECEIDCSRYSPAEVTPYAPTHAVAQELPME